MQRISSGLYVRPIPETGKEAQRREAYRLLETVLNRVYHIALPPIERDSHGKPGFPSLPSLQFNLSHCAGLAVCGVGSDGIGVDTEYIRPRRPAVMRRCFSPAETAAVLESDRPDEQFFRFWTLKESYVKAIGIGISYPLHTVCFRQDGAHIASNCVGWKFSQFLYRENWIVSCCVPESAAVPVFMGEF